MIGAALRLVRVYHDLSQASLADNLGVSKSFLSEVEAGKKKVTIELLDKYAVFFDIPKSSLMLFAENVSENKVVTSVQSCVAEKALKMLDWIATISKSRV